MTEPSIVFLDTETVTLEPGPDVIWEIGAILREPGEADRELLWQVRPNMAKAQPQALEISRFHERFLLPDGLDAAMVVETVDGPGLLCGLELTGDHDNTLRAGLVDVLSDAHIVGNVPNFDTERIGLLLGALGAGACWHYHLTDVENLAVGYLHGRAAPVRTATAPTMAGFVANIRDVTTPPWDSDVLSRAVGVEPPGDDARHTALGDARWARDLYDRVTGRPAAVAAQ